MKIINKYVYILLAVCLLSPASAFAGTSLTFSPSSPQTYGGATDPTATCDATGDQLWTVFLASGLRKTGDSSIVFDDGGYTGHGCPTVFSTNVNGHVTLDGYAGSAQTLTFVEFHENVGATQNISCLAQATASVSACQADPAYMATVTYTLSSGGGGGGGSATSTAATSSVMQFATSTCTRIDATTTVCVTPLQTLRVQDAGNLILMLAFILFPLWIIMVGFIWNSFIL